MDEYQKYIASSRYARWLPEKGRREEWDETVERYMDFWNTGERKGGDAISAVAPILEKAIKNLEVMMTAGAALERDNVAGFNCAFAPVNHVRVFDECMYILMCGTGVGYSVERQDIAKLPELPFEFQACEKTIRVADSKIGWADAFRQLIAALYSGRVPEWDVSKVRGEGEVLKTFGGRASGPQPLVNLFNYTVATFKAAKESRLTSIEVSDIMCKIGEVVVVGGVRRSALICLSNPSDGRMRTAKSGNWQDTDMQRRMANISSCYTSKPDLNFFYSEMGALYESKSGERGIFNREAARKIAGLNGRRETDHEFGTNPCSEIILRPFQFCNLTEVVVRSEDSLPQLKAKVAKATILGTLQASLTDFRYLRPIWKKNTEEEALLGVSLTGIMDHPVLSGRLGTEDMNYADTKATTLGGYLEAMRNEAVKVNKEWAERIGINAATAITCVKPSGTVSQLVNSASGIHPRHSEHYIRTVRGDSKDPLTQYMVDAGFPVEDQIGSDGATKVFSFPIAAPEGCITNSSLGAMEHLELWKTYQMHWCEHKPSITVNYTDDEYLDVCAWIWKNFDIVSGIALFPLDDNVYEQAVYKEITSEVYEELLDKIPSFNWTDAAAYEKGSDSTTGSQTLACTANNCEI